MEDSKAEHWTDQDVRPRDISIRFLGLDTIADVYEKVKQLKDKLLKEESEVLRLKALLADQKKKIVIKDDEIRNLQEQHNRRVRDLEGALSKRDGSYLSMKKDELDSTRFMQGLLMLWATVRGFSAKSSLNFGVDRKARPSTVRYLLGTVKDVHNALTNILLNLTEEIDDRAQEYKLADDEGLINEADAKKPWWVTVFNFFRTGRCYADEPLEDILYR